MSTPLQSESNQVAAPGGHWPPHQQGWVPVKCSPRPAQSCNSHFQPEAKMLPVGGEYGIIPSRLLWETRFSDQETRCLKQTKNTLRSEWKSMRDNVWKVINSKICGGEREKWRPFHPTERQWVRGREKVEKQPTILMTNVSSRAGRVGMNVTQRTLSESGRGPHSEPREGKQPKIHIPNKKVELSQGVEA